MRRQFAVLAISAFVVTAALSSDGAAGTDGGTIVAVDGSTLTVTVRVDLCCAHDAS